MARPRTRRRDERVERKPKKRVSILDSEQIVYVDYKDVNLLRRFMSERAKIRARRVTGNDTQQQREVARAIRVAREMALLPYSVRQVTHRSKRRGERGPERDGGGPELANEAIPRDDAEVVGAEALVDVNPTDTDTDAGDDE
jgi:small subunit ribosomal protein S18